MSRLTRSSKKPKKANEDHLITSLNVVQSPLTAPEIDPDSYETHFDLIVDNFTSETIKQLQKYSTVTSFGFYSDSFNCDHLLQALAVWKRKIISLTVHITENRNCIPENSLADWREFFIDAPKICTAIKCLYVEDANICNFINDNATAHLTSTDQYLYIPKKLKFESLYFGLPIADVQSASDQMSSGQFKQLTKLSIFNSSKVESEASKSIVPFQLPQTVASNLTHYSTIQELFFESFTFRNLTFSSLTHLQLKTMLSLEKLFQFLAGNGSFPKLEYLSIDNRSSLNHVNNLLGNMSLKRKMPEDERECVFVPVFQKLTTLEIHHPPHDSFSMTPSSFPALTEVQLKIFPNESMFGCKFCLENGNYKECHKVFYQSFKEWKDVEVFYDNMSV